ncbi:hypothetical protein [Aquimarina intermedia]|uniref:Uncharacterized protein n=1 Tax=Aquimarina intermedia TaxID=350814 RepID=A0A5S5CFT2_9FLAO|nr:hypothetical protein [Aquimarina intermedia]TYP76863.1 hypothetical protein BD809_1018 [Aquimarina intermedia]
MIHPIKILILNEVSQIKLDMKKILLSIILLGFTIVINAQWNPDGNNATVGAVIIKNPGNTAANSVLSWYNDTARIRIGGSGKGAENGFLIQGVGEKKLFEVNDGFARVFNPSNSDANFALSWWNNYARLRIGGSGNGVENGFLIQGVGEKKLFEVNDGFAKIFNPRNRAANFTMSWFNNVARLRIGGSGEGAANGFEIHSVGEKKLMKLTHNGNLAIYGKIESNEVKVSLTPTADFVFENDYNLPTLDFIENYIKEKKHLPEIAAAKEMKKNGVNIGEFQIQLLQKIEELTLYTINQEKKINEQANEIKELKSLNDEFIELQSRIEKLESKK